MTLLGMLTFRVSCRTILALFILPVCYSSHYAQVPQPRPLVPDDILRLAELSETRLSPDAQWVAYVVKRPKADGGFFGRAFLVGNDHADVWIAPVAGGKAQNLTNGAVDDSGFWRPRWSPDGERLAMLSTRGGNVRLWLWTRSSGRLELLSERGAYSVGINLYLDPFTWISNQEVVIALLPPGEKPVRMETQTRVAEITAREWAKAWAGKEPTASVLESGAPVFLETRPQGQMLMIDVNSRSVRVIATGADFGQPVFSPDKSHVAFLKQVDVWHPDPNKEVTRLYPSVFQVMVTNLQGAVTTRTLRGAREAIEGSLLWSPDGTELAFVGNDKEPSASDTSDLTVFRCRISDETCRRITEQRTDLDFGRQNLFYWRSVMWVGRNRLLIFARPQQTSSPVEEPQPKGWRWSEGWRWLGVDEKGRLQDLFGNTKGLSPSQIVPEAAGETLIGIIEGSVWRIGSDGRALQNLTPNFKEKITSIVWPDLQSSGARAKDLMIVGVRHNSIDDLYLLDLKSGEVKSFMKPSPEASLVAFNSENGTGIFRSDVAGTYLWAKDARAKTFAPIVETNTFLREISPGEARKIEYRSLDGQPLKGWVILPYGYEEGKRYPVVVYVYAGTVYADTPPRLYPSSQRAIFASQLLPAHGYAVLLPSMPLKPFGEVEDPYMELTKGVLPAVDKIVDLGIADPKRVGLFGWSNGGYNVYGLVTQTNRFQAAIAGAGFCDLISMYGTFSAFDGRSRYDVNAHEDPLAMWNTEGLGMGGPPWKDLGRYLRNSPINYVERVETPLMIIHGDLDPAVGIEQGEEFFTALYRQNKRARFVRYWGEWHGIESPANIRDMWQRIYAWFDEFLMKPEDKKPVATK